MNTFDKKPTTRPAAFTDHASAKQRSVEKTILVLTMAYNFGLIDPRSASYVLEIQEASAANDLRDLAKAKLLKRQETAVTGFVYYRPTKLGIELISNELPSYIDDVAPPNLNAKAGDQRAAHDLLAIIAAYEIAEDFTNDGDSFYFISDRVMRTDYEKFLGDEGDRFFPDVLIVIQKEDGRKLRVAVETQIQRESWLKIDDRIKRYAYAISRDVDTANRNASMHKNFHEKTPRIVVIASHMPMICANYLKPRKLSWAEPLGKKMINQEGGSIEVAAVETDFSRVLTESRTQTFTQFELYSHDLSQHKERYFLK